MYNFLLGEWFRNFWDRRVLQVLTMKLFVIKTALLRVKEFDILTSFAIDHFSTFYVLEDEHS